MRTFARALLPFLLAASAAFAHTDQGCEALPPELAAEIAAMRGTAQPLEAIDSLGQVSTNVELSRRYDVTLTPQSAMRFPVPPARHRALPEATAGLVYFRTGKAGRYRIGLTSRHWIDVLDNGKTIDSVTHRGHTGCALLHKVVEFDLPAGRILVLQFSGAADATVGLVITGPA